MTSLSFPVTRNLLREPAETDCGGQSMLSAYDRPIAVEFGLASDRLTILVKYGLPPRGKTVSWNSGKGPEKGLDLVCDASTRKVLSGSISMPQSPGALRLALANMADGLDDRAVDCEGYGFVAQSNPRFLADLIRAISPQVETAAAELDRPN